MNLENDKKDTSDCAIAVMEARLTVNQILNRFEPLIKNLNAEGNLRIGGSSALRLHGLNFRHSNDVDIIIVAPTARQKAVIEALKTFDKVVNYQTAAEDRHAWKFEKYGATIDLIMEREDLVNKSDLVAFYVSCLKEYIPVQRVNRVIEAKASYIIHNDNDRAELRCRKKDAVDFINLKNDNFNF